MALSLWAILKTNFTHWNVENEDFLKQVVRIVKKLLYKSGLDNTTPPHALVKITRSQRRKLMANKTELGRSYSLTLMVGISAKPIKHTKPIKLTNPQSKCFAVTGLKETGITFSLLLSLWWLFFSLKILSSSNPNLTPLHLSKWDTMG